MKPNFVITILTTASVILSHPAIADLEIRQEVFEFSRVVTRNVSCVTFVINESPAPNELPTSCWLSIIPFDLGSAVLSPAAGETILADFRRCEVLQNAPFTVTGHTCNLGSEKLNNVLSLQRAEAVAEFLAEQGFTVAVVQGKGSQIAFTDETAEFHKNRRVEITQQEPEQKQSM